MKRLFLLVALCVPSLACAPLEGDDEDADDDDVSESEAQALAVKNPVQKNCADPAVMKHGSVYYMTCTGGDGKGGHFPIYKASGLSSPWTKDGVVFPAGKAPAWADGNWWAPELHHVGGKIVAYFTARSKKNGKNAIGVAVADTPTGEYKDKGAPLVNPAWSVIDAHELDGILYVKSENVDHLVAIPLSPNGMNLAGDARTILRVTEGWEGKTVEGPWVTKRGSYTYLFYSGNYFCNDSYAVGVARTKTPRRVFDVAANKSDEVWEKKGKPILTSGKNWVGPGHNAVATGLDGKPYIVYHAFKRSEGTPRCGEPVKDNDTRHTLVSPIVYKAGWPTIAARL